MKLLVISYAYHPSIGGIETVTRTLCQQFVAAGHQVRIVTHTPGPVGPVDGIEVARRPSARQLWKWHRWCDVCLHSNISLTYAWPMFVRKRPWVTVVHGATGIDTDSRSLIARLKLACLRRSRRIAVSQSVAQAIGLPCFVVGNPLQVFPRPTERSRKGLVFLGRLVSDKGADFLLRVLARIPTEKRPRCTIIGEGDEQSRLSAMVTELGLAPWVRMAGVLVGPSLWETLGANEILAVPSQFDEPFGVVAIEGIACGCFVVASNRGGLPDAVGPCGLLLPPDDIDAWAEALPRIFADNALRARHMRFAEDHLKQFRPDVIASIYLDICQEALLGRRLLRHAAVFDTCHEPTEFAHSE